MFQPHHDRPLTSCRRPRAVPKRPRAALLSALIALAALGATGCGGGDADARQKGEKRRSPSNPVAARSSSTDPEARGDHHGRHRRHPARARRRRPDRRQDPRRVRPRTRAEERLAALPSLDTQSERRGAGRRQARSPDHRSGREGLRQAGQPEHRRAGEAGHRHLRRRRRLCGGPERGHLRPRSARRRHPSARHDLRRGGPRAETGRQAERQPRRRTPADRPGAPDQGRSSSRRSPGSST